MICENCKKEDAVDNEFNYILCEKCLEYYMGVEIERLVEMTDYEQTLYWHMYEQEHKRL